MPPPHKFLKFHLHKACTCCSVAQSCLTLQPHGLSTPGFPVPSPSPGVCSNSCPLNWWCQPTLSSSVGPFSSCLLSFPASGSFPINHLFASDGQNIGASASASVFPINIQGWFPVGLTGLILLSKGLSSLIQQKTLELFWFSHIFFLTVFFTDVHFLFFIFIMFIMFICIILCLFFYFFNLLTICLIIYTVNLWHIWFCSLLYAQWLEKHLST